MTFPILQHNFKYVGMNQLSLQHQFIYIFETFIFKYEKDIFLTNIEQDKLSKKYTQLFLNNLGENIDKNISNNKELNINTQKHIIKNESKYKNIDSSYKNISVNDNKQLLDSLNKNIFKNNDKQLLNNLDDIKYIKNQNSNKEIINIESNFKIIIKDKKIKQLINFSNYKMILKNKNYKNLFNYRILQLEKGYKKKQLFNFISNIVKKTNNEKELKRIMNQKLLINSSNKFVSQFIDSDSLQKIDFLKKILEESIRDQIKELQNKKILDKCSSDIYNDMKSKKIHLSRIFEYLNKDSRIILLNRNILNLYKAHNKIDIKSLYRLDSYCYKDIKKSKFIDKYEKDIYRNEKYKEYLSIFYRNIRYIKYVNKGLIKNYRSIFKEKCKNKSIINFHTNIFKDKYNKIFISDFYKNIFKDKYAKRYTALIWSSIFKNKHNKKYLLNFYRNIFKHNKIRFLNKQAKYTKFSNNGYKTLKKDCKLSILRVNTKERFVKIHNKYIYKDILKTKYTQNGIEDINKYLLKQYYFSKYDINNIIKYKSLNEYLNKQSTSLYKIFNHNRYLIKINSIYKNLSYKKYLKKEEVSIYLIKNKYRFLEKSWINIYKTKYKTKYLDIQRKWWILGHDDNLTDKLIIPNIDYPYETDPVIGINKHPISSYQTINYNDISYGTKEIEVSIKVMQQMLNYLFVIWNCALFDWYKLEAKDAMPKIMDVFYYWINLDNVKEEMVQKESREDYLRVYRWFRWETEKVWFKTKDYTYDEKNNGIKSVGMLLGNIIEYMKNHHYNIVPITSSYNLTIMGNILIAFTWQLPDYFRPTDKYKGKRKYYISNKTIDKIKKKLIYQK